MTTYDKEWVTDKYVMYVWEPAETFSCDTFLANMHYNMKHRCHYTPLPLEMAMLGLIADVADSILPDSSLDT